MRTVCIMAHMRINTHVREQNEKKATKILRKGRGAWGDFVNKALEAEDPVNDLVVKSPETNKDTMKNTQQKLADPGKEY